MPYELRQQDLEIRSWSFGDENAYDVDEWASNDRRQISNQSVDGPILIFVGIGESSSIGEENQIDWVVIVMRLEDVWNFFSID